MKISTRTRYGMRLLIDLAEHVNEKHVSLSTIAERQNISCRYLEQVAVILRRSHFIRSVKGALGGYVLAKRPEDIIVGSVLRVLEGDMLIVDPPLPNVNETKIQRCVRLAVFDHINTCIAYLIDKKTLASLADITNADASFMYYI